MVNLQDFIEGSPLAKKLKADELLFAEFKCPVDSERSNVWWHNNFFAHVLTGETILKTPAQEYVLAPGSSVFAKKGSIISFSHDHQDFCELLIFVPDEFIKTIVKKYQVILPQSEGDYLPDTLIALTSDEILTSYFHSLVPHFHQAIPPSKALLRLKFEELLLHIISTSGHLSLKSYFAGICRISRPSIREIMEANFFSNLSLDEFARLSARSLTSFKKEFHSLFNTTPGKWLLTRRLEYARYLLETTNCSIEEICLDSGFEDTSHFTRAFRSRYDLPPAKFRGRTTTSPLALQQDFSA